MPKLLLTLALLTAGAGLTWNLHQRAALATAAADEARQSWLTQTQRLAQAHAERATLGVRVKERKEEISRQRATAAEPDTSPLLAFAHRAHLSPAESERLLAELGFNWQAQPDYVVVSKESLKNISLPGMQSVKLTEVASKVLAVTPEERNALETTARELGAEYNAWAQANVHREEPSGDVLAKYSLSPDAAFSQSLSNRFVQSVAGTLDPERSELLHHYSYDWMKGLGMFGGEPATLTIKRYNSGDTFRLNMKFSQGGSSMSCDISPWQPLPEAFRPVFPGGWADLAQREGFELPKEFRRK